MVGAAMTESNSERGCVSAPCLNRATARGAYATPLAILKAVAFCAVLVFLPAIGSGQNKQKDTEKKVTPAITDDSQKLLAEKDRQKGPRSPGLDPAFLVLPRPAERNTIAQELLTEEVRGMTSKA